MAAITRLPLEIWGELIEKLCPHCTPVSVRDGHRAPSPRAAIHTLASLCLVSKSLSHYATRHLYHRPDNRKWWRLAETLLARSDLADHVKHLDLMGCGWLQQDFPGEQEHRNKLAWLLAHTALALSDEEKAEFLERGRDHLYTSGSVLCSLCPNVQRLKIEQGLIDKAPYVPGSMPHLEHLEVEASDPEYGFDVGTIESLLLAAPNITHLTLNNASYCPDDMQATLGRLVRLDIEWSNISAATLANLLRASPRLERLSFASNGLVSERSEDHLTPREAKDAVIAHAPPTLKSFYLDTLDMEWFDRDVDIPAETLEAEAALAARGIEFTYAPHMLVAKKRPEPRHHELSPALMELFRAAREERAAEQLLIAQAAAAAADGQTSTGQDLLAAQVGDGAP